MITLYFWTIAFSEKDFWTIAFERSLFERFYTPLMVHYYLKKLKYLDNSFNVNQLATKFERWFQWTAVIAKYKVSFNK